MATGVYDPADWLPFQKVGLFFFTRQHLSFYEGWPRNGAKFARPAARVR